MVRTGNYVFHCNCIFVNWQVKELEEQLENEGLHKEIKSLKQQLELLEEEKKELEEKYQNAEEKVKNLKHSGKACWQFHFYSQYNVYKNNVPLKSS